MSLNQYDVEIWSCSHNGSADRTVRVVAASAADALTIARTNRCDQHEWARYVYAVEPDLAQPPRPDKAPVPVLHAGSLVRFANVGAVYRCGMVTGATHGLNVEFHKVDDR